MSDLTSFRRSSPLFTMKLLASQPGSPPKGLEACREARRSAQVTLLMLNGLALVLAIPIELGVATVVEVVVA